MKQTLLGWMWTTNDVMRYKQSRANQISEKKNNRKEIETRINSLVNVFKLNFQWNHLARSGMYVCDIATVYVYIWWRQKHPCIKLISFAKKFHLDSLCFQNNFTDFRRITLKCHKVQWRKLRRNIVCFKLLWACDEQIRNNLEWKLLALINVLLLFSAENSQNFSLL